MMHNEEYTRVVSNKVKNNEIKHKEQAKIKRIMKEQERRDREPSCRLGKIMKKITSRSAKILDIEKEEENEDEKEENEEVMLKIGIKPIRIKLTRPKRKPGHRDRSFMNNF